MANNRGGRGGRGPTRFTWADAANDPRWVIGLIILALGVFAPATLGKIIGQTAMAVAGPLVPLAQWFLMFLFVAIGLKIMLGGLTSKK